MADIGKINDRGVIGGLEGAEDAFGGSCVPVSTFPLNDHLLVLSDRDRLGVSSPPSGVRNGETETPDVGSRVVARGDAKPDTITAARASLDKRPFEASPEPPNVAFSVVPEEERREPDDAPAHTPDPVEARRL